MDIFPSPKKLYDAIQARKIALRPIHTAILHENISLVFQQKTLTELLSCFHANGTLKTPEAIAFLKQHWERTKLTAYSYTAQPQAELTTFLVNLALFINAQEKQTAISYLMPGIPTESIDEEIYSNLDTIDLSLLLNTHVIGQEGQYLIPIKQHIEYTETRQRGKKLPNVYFDYSVDAEDKAYLKEEDMQRVIAHSSETQALETAFCDWYQWEKEQVDLLSQLKVLCRALNFYDAHGGVGSQTHAGEGAYAAIIKFREYYEKLSRTEQIKNIPENLRKAIELLFQMGTKRTQAQEIESCIGLRKEHLLQEISNEHTQKIIARITLSEDAARSSLHKQYLATKKGLENSLASKKYTGYDKLSLNTDLLRWLKFELHIQSDNDIDFLMHASNIDIQQILNYLPHLKQEIARIYSNLATLIPLLISNFQDEKIKTILTAAQPQMTREFKRHSYISTLLQLLSENKIKLISEVFKAQLQIAITDYRHLSAIFNPSPPPHRPRNPLKTEACYAFLSASPELFFAIIRNGEDLNSFLNLIPQKKEVFRFLKEFISKAEDVPQFLNGLNAEYRNTLFDSLNDKLQNLITNPIELITVIEALTEEERAQVYSLLHEYLLNLFKNGADTLKTLATHQSTLITNVLKNIVYNIKDLTDILNSLDENQYFLSLPIVQDLIRNPEDIKNLFENLLPQYHNAVFHALKKPFKDIIHSIEDLKSIFHILTLEECEEFYPLLKHYFISLIQQNFDINAVFSTLPGNQCVKTLSVFKKIILNKDELANILKALPKEKQVVFYQVLKNFITTPKDMKILLNYLAPQYYNAFYPVIKENFKNIIHHTDDFITLFDYLEPNVRNEIFTRVVKNSRDLNTLFVHLPAEKRATIEPFNEILETFIQTPADLSTLLYHLPHASQTIAEELLNRFKRLIQNSSDLRTFISHFDSNHYSFLFEHLKPQIKTLIEDKEELAITLNGFNTEQRAEFFSFLSVFLTNIEEIEQLFNNLDAQYHSQFFDYLEHQLQSLIQTPGDLIVIFLALETDIKLPTLLENKLLEIIQKTTDFDVRLNSLSTEQQLKIYKAFLKTPSILKTILSSEKYTPIYHALKNNFTTIIRNQKDLGAILFSLSGVEYAYFCNFFKEDLTHFFKDATDFISFFDHYIPNSFDCSDQDRISPSVEPFKEHIKSLIHHVNDLFVLSEYLNDKLYGIICHSIQDKAPNVLRQLSNFTFLFKNTISSQATIVQETFKDQLITLIQNASDFKEISQIISIKHTYLYTLLKNRPNEFIQSSADFNNIFCDLNESQQAEIYLLIKNKLHHFIQNRDDFRSIFPLLNKSQRTEIYPLIKEKLPSMVQNTIDFKCIFTYLTEEQRAEIYPLLKEKLATQIQNYSDYDNVLPYLKPEHYATICQDKKHLIHTASDFYELLFHLSPQQCLAACHVFNNEFTQVIHQVQDFEEVLYLKDAQLREISDFLKEQLKDIIQDFESFQSYLLKFSGAQYQEFFPKLTPLWCGFMENPIHFKSLNQRLPLEKMTLLNRAWMNSLLDELQEFSSEKKLQDLHTALSKATDDFFLNYTPAGYQTFSATCQQEINKIYPNLHQEKNNIFIKLLYAIKTIGIIATLKTIYKNVFQGTALSFWAPTERLATKILDFVDAQQQTTIPH